MDEAWVDQLVARLGKEHGLVCYAKMLAEEVVLLVNMEQSGMDKERVVGAGEESGRSVSHTALITWNTSFQLEENL
jgi:hypothetical protein